MPISLSSAHRTRSDGRLCSVLYRAARLARPRTRPRAQTHDLQVPLPTLTLTSDGDRLPERLLFSTLANAISYSK